MFKAGITGNIGSGKSTVAKIFAQLGIPVYDADSRAKALMEGDALLVQQIKNLLGDESYTSSHQLNRAFVASRVFNNEPLLKQLNALVHPAVFRDFDEWAASQHAPYVLKEAALLIESGSFKDLNFLMVVTADEDQRLLRSMARDGATREAIQARMKNQMPQEEKVMLADAVLRNNENDMVLPQVLTIHENLLKLAAQR